MSDLVIQLQLEIPSEIAQQEVWDFETRIKQIPGITTDLREPKDLLATTSLFIQIIGPYIGTAVTVAAGINTIHELAQTIYTFLHPKEPEADQQGGKHNVVIITKGKRIEIADLSLEEIETLMKH